MYLVLQKQSDAKSVFLLLFLTLHVCRVLRFSYFVLLLRKEIGTRIYVIFLKLLAPVGTVLQKLTTIYLSLS